MCPIGTVSLTNTYNKILIMIQKDTIFYYLILFLTHHLYIVLCYHPKSSHFPSPLISFLPPPTSLTVFPSYNHHTVYMRGLGFFCLITSPFSPSPQAPSPLTSVNLFSVSISLFLFCLFVCSLDSTCK